MDPIASDRQARLKPERADRHPSLPASMWTSAVHMAELVASWPRVPGCPDTTGTGRRLSDEDFEFRGSGALAVNGSVLPPGAARHHIRRQ